MLHPGYAAALLGGTALVECGTVIRSAEEKDIPAIYSLELAAFINPYPPWYLSILLSLAGDLFLVAESGGVDGYAVAIPLRGSSCHLASIAVAPRCRRRHVGASLLASIIHLCSEKGKHCLILEVERTNYPAQRLYAVFGFRYAGIMLNYYGPGRDALIMTKCWAPGLDEYSNTEAPM